MQTFEVSRRRRERDAELSKESSNDSKRTERSIYKHLVAPRMQKPRMGRSRLNWNRRRERAPEVTQGKPPDDLTATDLDHKAKQAEHSDAVLIFG